MRTSFCLPAIKMLEDKKLHLIKCPIKCTTHIHVAAELPVYKGGNKHLRAIKGLIPRIKYKRFATLLTVLA